MKTTTRSLLFFLLFAPLLVMGQTIVTGTVIEQSTSIPLPGVNVLVKGTTTGTATDFDGNYQLEVNEGDVILFSYVGYQSQEITFSGQATIDVMLMEDAAQLDEIVIIGYGSVKKEDLTGSVDVISSDDFNQGAVVSPDQLLVGKAAGVRITNDGGQPDAAPNIRIRGGSSLSGNNSPLIVIDGVPLDNGGIAGVGNPLSLINPNDIESFSVLKDASATAIYGSRASNGVLIITTKKGTSGEAKFNFSARTSLSSISTRNQIEVMDGSTFVRFVETYLPDSLNALGVPVGSAVTNEEVARIISTPSGNRAIYNTDWQDAIYRTAVTKDYNFGVRANLFEKIPFRASIGYNETEGVVKTNDYERITASVRISPKFFDDHLKVDINAKSTSVQKNSVDEGGAIGGAVSMDPTKPIYDANSIFGGYYQQLRPSDDPNAPNEKIGSTNPLAVLMQRTRPEDVDRLLGNIELDYKFHVLPELRAVVNLGVEASRATIGEYFTEGAVNSYTLVSSADPNNPLPNGTYILQPGESFGENQHITNTTMESYLAYRKEFDNFFIHNFDIQAGYSYQNFKNDGNKREYTSDPAYSADLNPDQYDLDNDGITNDRVRNINPNNPNNRYFNEVNLQSFFGRVNVNLANRYLLTASFRADASSFFTKENRWGYFPSAALAWKAKEEPFLQDVAFINDFKIRLGWGQTGQQDVSGQVGFYPSIPLFEIGSQQSQYISGVNLYNALEFNPDLTWEKTSTYNAGVDFDFFNRSILSGSFDIFYRETTDLLVLTGVPPGQALSDQVIQNVGETESKGFELNLNLNPIQNDVVNLSLNGNLSYNITEVKDLKGVERITVNTDEARLDIGTGNFLLRHAVGEQAGSAWVLKQVYDTNGDPILGSFVDLNGDGRITDEDRYFKAMQPNWTFGFGFTFNYKNWELSSSLRGQLDGYIYNSRRLSQGTIQGATSLDGNSLFNQLNFYTGAANPVFTRIADPVQYSDYFIEGASFLRCENIVLAHTLNDVIKNATLRVFGAVNNPFLITNYSGQDPENFAGIDKTFYPRATIYNLGVTIDF
ncbi:SusC/RagA family TonB-linked outer membrane protein [Aestuariivivens sediminicola]|uniref:SusC/RagA family TonB-linked outer membrane protein n=1 Tax=Aestuariivivens sediminicola TaxID=2913560 RepID=UPI001F59EA4F|nr:SusC/RagA family TonB-linked outer membrane protein [Aestuariivivens sediminicola]